MGGAQLVERFIDDKPVKNLVNVVPGRGSATSSTASKGRDEGRLRMSAAALRAITVRIRADAAPSSVEPARRAPRSHESFLHHLLC